MRFILAGLLSAAALLAQDAPLPDSSVVVRLPKDAPVTKINQVTDESRTRASGAAIVVDLHMTLTLRNTGSNRIHGITMRVVSQEVTLGGKASVSMPSLNIGPGETFPVRIDQRLIRPTQIAAGPLVEVSLDGVLFQDLSFYGPDKLNSRRSMIAWEKEAQRDREYFKRVLAQSGAKGLQEAMVASMARQSEIPRLQVGVVSHGRAVTSAATAAPEQTERFAFLEFPDSPVVPVEGWAQVAGNEARAPRIHVRNRSTRPVKFVELGWLVKDQSGQEYMAASVPSSNPDLYLPAGKTGSVEQDTSLRFTRNGQPVNVQGMTGFVKQVEFADGQVWVPNRQNLELGPLPKTIPASLEEQRLSDVYRKRGIEALILELKKF